MHKLMVTVFLASSLFGLAGCQSLANLGFLLALWSASEGASADSSRSALGSIDVVGVDDSGLEVPADCAWSVEDGRVLIGEGQVSEAGPSWLRFAVEGPIDADGSGVVCCVGGAEERVVLRLRP